MYDRAEVDIVCYVKGAAISCKKSRGELLRPNQDRSYVRSRLNVDTGDADVPFLHPRQVIDDDLDDLGPLQVNDIENAPFPLEVFQDQPTMAMISGRLAAE